MNAKRKGDRASCDTTIPMVEITTSSPNAIIAQTTTPVNPLAQIRMKSGASAKAVVEIVRRRHPKYDMPLQSKCERTELYGIQLADDSMKDLRRELTPEEEKRAAWIRQGRHKLTKSVRCRLTDEEYGRFCEVVQKRGFETVQDFLAMLIRQCIEASAEINPRRAEQEQAQYCRDNGYPHFAPSGGRCYRCHEQIYDSKTRSDGSISRGIDVYQAGHTLITGCPHCHYSFVE